MRDALPELSAMCTRSEHGRCPHRLGAGVARPWRRSRASQTVLCGCPCHAQCPLAGERRVATEVWDVRCSCPGAEVARATSARSGVLERIMADADFSDHPDAEEIEERLGAVFAEHGQPAPPGLTGWSRIIAAGTAQPGSRLPRLLGIGARAVASTVRWSNGRASTDRDAQNREQTRSGYRVAAVVAAVAMTLTVAAVVSTGWRRLLWGVAAALAWLLSGYTVTLITAVASIARSAEAHARAEDLPSR